MRPFEDTGPKRPIRTTGRNRQSTCIPSARYLELQFLGAKRMLAKADRALATKEGLEADLLLGLPASAESLANGIEAWCVLANMDAFARNLPTLYPNMPPTTETLVAIVSSGRDFQTYRVMFGFDDRMGYEAPFPGMDAVVLEHGLVTNHLEPLVDRSVLDLADTDLARAQNTADVLGALAYMVRDHDDHRTVVLGRHVIQDEYDITDDIIRDEVLPRYRGLMATICAAAKKNRNLAIPKNWYPRPMTPEELEGARLAQGREAFERGKADVVSAIARGDAEAAPTLAQMTREIADAPADVANIADDYLNEILD